MKEFNKEQFTKVENTEAIVDYFKSKEKQVTILKQFGLLTWAVLEDYRDYKWAITPEVCDRLVAFNNGPDSDSDVGFFVEEVLEEVTYLGDDWVLIQLGRHPTIGVFSKANEEPFDVEGY